MNKRKLLGFTLIELLIVVSVIGILAGATVGLINLDTTKERARDGVRQASLEKTIQGIEAFYILEDRYPEADSGSPDGDGNPLTGPDGDLLATYLTKWPTGDTGEYIYSKIDDDNFVLGVLNSTSQYYKYHSSWGEISDCTSLSIDDQCSDGGPVIEPGGTTYQHNVCSGTACVSVDCSPNTSPCADTCSSSSECTAPPPPPEPPVPCTESECNTYCIDTGWVSGRCDTGGACACRL